METSSSSYQAPDPSAARMELAGIARARDAVAARAAAPWWYHLGAGGSTAILFASVGLPYEFVTYGVVFGGILLPALLMWLVKRSTGVGIDRYRIPREGGAWYMLHFALFVLLLGVGMFAKLGLQFPFAMVIAGGFVLAPAVRVSRRIEQGYQRELRATL